MALINLNFRSQVLSANVNVTVAYPTDNYSCPKAGAQNDSVYMPGMKFQTIYLLHGGGDDDSLVYRYTNAETFAEENQVMLVTPSVVNSFNIDTKYGVCYYTYLTEELPVMIRSLFASCPKREDNFIMGFAMGGNGALGTAIRRPDMFSACVDLSGGIGLTLDMDELKSNMMDTKFKLYSSSFEDADKLDGSAHDLMYYAKKNLKDGVPLPEFYLCGGSEEGAIGIRVRNDARLLKKLGGYKVYYEEAAGHGHNFDMWDKYIKTAMDKWLPLKRKPIYPEE